MPDPYKNGTPCEFCIRMVGDHCREQGCLHDAFRSATIYFTPGRWYATDELLRLYPVTGTSGSDRSRP